MSVRIAERRDWEGILAIYNEAIAGDSRATADTEPVTLEKRGDWLAAHSADRHPIYVEEDEDGVLRGWCSISAYRCGRAALQHTAELSYYAAAEHRRCGVATRLLKHAMADCPRLGLKSLFGILLDTNEASIALLRKHGFEEWGHLPRVAEFDGVECGHLYLGKRVVD